MSSQPSQEQTHINKVSFNRRGRSGFLKAVTLEWPLTPRRIPDQIAVARACHSLISAGRKKLLRVSEEFPLDASLDLFVINDLKQTELITRVGEIIDCSFKSFSD